MSFTELNTEKIHLQIMSSNVGKSEFKRLVVFCTKKGAGRPSIS
jgi:hypothetical protein